MVEVGRRWECKEVFLPDVMLAAEAMKASISLLLPRITVEERGRVSLGKVVIGTALGDIHDIGKSLVAMMLSVEGFHVVDLGTDVSPNTFVEAAAKEDARIIAMSSLLTTSLPFQRDVIKYLEDTGKRKHYFVLSGGGCVTPDWVRKSKADGYARLAVGAARIARRLISKEFEPPLAEPLIEE
jgi:methylmalonyl-CoA mutase cobalamin-binding domain/chain